MFKGHMDTWTEMKRGNINYLLPSISRIISEMHLTISMLMSKICRQCPMILLNNVDFLCAEKYMTKICPQRFECSESTIVLRLSDFRIFTLRTLEMLYFLSFIFIFILDVHMRINYVYNLSFSFNVHTAYVPFYRKSTNNRGRRTQTS